MMIVICTTDANGSSRKVVCHTSLDDAIYAAIYFVMSGPDRDANVYVNNILVESI